MSDDTADHVRYIDRTRTNDPAEGHDKADEREGESPLVYVAPFGLTR